MCVTHLLCPTLKDTHCKLYFFSKADTISWGLKEMPVTCFGQNAIEIHESTLLRHVYEALVIKASRLHSIPLIDGLFFSSETAVEALSFPFPKCSKCSDVAVLFKREYFAEFEMFKLTGLRFYIKPTKCVHCSWGPCTTSSTVPWCDSIIMTRSGPFWFG